VSLKEINNKLVLIVADNGIGIKDVSQLLNAKSFGYELIEAFKEKLNAQLNIESKNGTSITLSINDYTKVA